MHQKILQALNNKRCLITIGYNKESWICEIGTNAGFFWFTPLGWAEREKIENRSFKIKEIYKWKSKRELFAAIRKEHTLYKGKLQTEGTGFCYWRYKIKLKAPWVIG